MLVLKNHEDTKDTKNSYRETFGTWNDDDTKDLFVVFVASMLWAAVKLPDLL